MVRRDFVIVPNLNRRRTIDLIFGILLIAAVGLSTSWVSAQSLDTQLEQCAVCALPLLQLKPANISDVSQLIQNEAKVDEFFRAAITALSCMEQCVGEQNTDLKDLITDANDVLKYLQEHVSVVRDNVKCLSSDAQTGVIKRCVELAISSEDFPIKVTSCSAANEAYRCLRDQVCRSGGGGSQSGSAGGRLTAKLFQLGTKSTLKRLHGCAVNASGASKVTKTDNVVMLLLISAVTSATFPIYLM